jgi:hypothetical protein
MKIPKYWMRREGDVQRPDGTPLRLSAWGWSDTSTSEAEGRAGDRFRSLQQRVTQGLELPRGYGYGSRPMREQILEEIPGPDGRPDALLTRNSYGSVVLNAARAMFVDVDVPRRSSPRDEPAGFSVMRMFGLGGGAKEQAAALDRLRHALAGSGGTFRVYRTAAGFRLLATDRVFVPASSDSESVMRATGADPAFVQLCRVQESFRARLTPKPWRMGEMPPPSQFPRGDREQEAAFNEWLERYERASASKATCRFVETVGSGWLHREIAPIVRLHDERTKAESDLPLA